MQLQMGTSLINKMSRANILSPQPTSSKIILPYSSSQVAVAAVPPANPNVMSPRYVKKNKEIKRLKIFQNQ